MMARLRDPEDAYRLGWYVVLCGVIYLCLHALGVVKG